MAKQSRLQSDHSKRGWPVSELRVAGSQSALFCHRSIFGRANYLARKLSLPTLKDGMGLVSHLLLLNLWFQLWTAPSSPTHQKIFWLILMNWVLGCYNPKCQTSCVTSLQNVALALYCVLFLKIQVCLIDSKFQEKHKSPIKWKYWSKNSSSHSSKCFFTSVGTAKGQRAIGVVTVVVVFRRIWKWICQSSLSMLDTGQGTCSFLRIQHRDLFRTLVPYTHGTTHTANC